MSENEQEQAKQDFEPFPQLVMMLATNAMQNMGLMAAQGQEPTVDLEAAQFSIDILDMLQKKTVGNLNEDEDKLLSEAVSNLQMMYVQFQQQAAAAAAPGATGAPEPAPASRETPPVEPSPPPPSDEEGDDKEPKFKKTYG